MGFGFFKKKKNIKSMIFNHNGYLNYELPPNWCCEENGETLQIYDPNGNGCITISFFNVLDEEKSLDEHMSIMAKKIIDDTKTKLSSSLVLDDTRQEKKILCGTGVIPNDHMFVKIWIVAKHPKIVLATYFCDCSEQKNEEIKNCDLMVDSMTFTC